MIQPGRLDIYADRWVACIRTFSFVDILLTNEFVPSAQVRALPDSSGTPLVALGGVATSASEGVWWIYAGYATVGEHIEAGRLNGIPPGTAITDTVLVSQIGLRINETTMEGLPLPDDVGSDLTLYWDLQITPAGGIKDKYLGGKFVVRSGVTQ